MIRSRPSAVAAMALALGLSYLPANAHLAFREPATPFCPSHHRSRRRRIGPPKAMYGMMPRYGASQRRRGRTPR